MPKVQRQSLLYTCAKTIFTLHLLGIWKRFYLLYPSNRLSLFNSNIMDHFYSINLLQQSLIVKFWCVLRDGNARTEPRSIMVPKTNIYQTCLHRKYLQLDHSGSPSSQVKDQKESLFLLPFLWLTDKKT